MKYLFLLLVFANMIVFDSFGQNKTDTNFILREYEIGNYYHAIFIDTSKKSSFYIDLENNARSEFDSAFYFEELRLFKKNRIQIVKHRIDDIPLSWSPLYLFKKNYYVYVPSDGLYNNWLQLNDSIFLSYAGGEMDSKAITSFRKIKDNQYTFDLTDQNNQYTKVNIYIVNENKGIAVFEYSNKINNDKTYELRVATNKIRNFPVIVNYCETQKQDELSFDKPNYKNILKN